MPGVSAHRVREAMAVLKKQKKENQDAAQDSDVPPTTPKSNEKAGTGTSKAGGSKKAAAAAEVESSIQKQKDPVGFMIYYFGVALMFIAVVRMIRGPLPFEKRLWEAIEEQSKGKAEYAKAKEAAALEMRAQIPLVFAAGDGDYEEVKRLIAAGHDVMERSKVGETPLHTAAISGNADVVKALLDAGADPNARTAGGQYLKMTPTHWMVFGKHEAGLAELIKAGADVNAQNTQGKTPMDMAISMNKHGVELLKMLHEAGGKPGSETGAEPPEDDPPEEPPAAPLEGSPPAEASDEAAQKGGSDERKQEL